VVLRFTPFRARWIKEQLWHPDQKMIALDDGGLELRLPVTDFREIKMKILQFGADVVVVAPEALREEVVAEIRRMREIYLADR
jgi:predicted DNA-binding transcriptional regulator YafY